MILDERTMIAVNPRVLLPVVACLLAAAGAVSAQQSPVQAAGVEYFRTYRTADSLYTLGRYAEAEDLFVDLTSDFTGDPSVWFRLARTHEELGDRGAAIEAYRSAHRIGYRYGAWIPYHIAQLYGETGESDSAYVWLDRALNAGLGDRSGIAEDTSFRALRGQPRFAEITGLPPADLPRDEGWRYDIDYLVAEARRMHSGPERPAYSSAFASAAEALKESVAGLSNDEIVVQLQRLAALLGDGHTGIYGPGSDSRLEFDRKTLPVLFRAFDEGLFIVEAEGGASRWIGSRVVAFGPRSTAEVLGDLRTRVHHDNPQTVLWLGVRHSLRRLPFLQAIGATSDPSAVTLTLEDRHGAQHAVRMEGGSFSFPRKLRPPPGPVEPPRWLRHVDRNYWLDPIPAVHALYWQFNQVRDREHGPSLAAFADTLRVGLEETGARTLIIDVRHNNGGNNGLLDPLLRTLVWWEQDESGRRIFVITGPNTFSAAQNFINRLEKWTDAVFVGEPSSSRPNFSGEETPLVLPYSRVRGSISNRYWQDSDPDDARPWIPPQVPVRFSADDYFSGRDPALAAIVEILRGDAGGSGPPDPREGPDASGVP